MIPLSRFRVLVVLVAGVVALGVATSAFQIANPDAFSTPRRHPWEGSKQSLTRRGMSVGEDKHVETILFVECGT